MRAPAVALAALCALTAGCASSPAPSQPTAISPAPASSTPAPASSTPPPVPSGPAAPAEHGSFSRCLHDHGVDEGSGSVMLGPPPGVDQSTWDTAVEACSTLAPGPAS